MKATTQGADNIISFLEKVAEVLRFSNLFPAAIFVLFNLWFFLPEYPEFPLCYKVQNIEEHWQYILLVFSISLLSYIFSALNDPIFRVYEGFPFRESMIGSILTGWNKYQMNWLKEEIEQLKYKKQTCPEEEKANIDKDIRVYEMELSDYYPAKEDPSVLPTRLGNTTAASEVYPKQKYGLDGILLWTRMVPVLIEKKYMPLIEREKNLVDFFLYLSFINIIFLFEYIFLGLYYIYDIELSILLLLGGLSYFWLIDTCFARAYS